MAEIFGTRRADQLFGTDENDLIRAGRGEDHIFSSLGDDTLYGGLGNDLIEDYEGVSTIYGMRGSDLISFARGEAWGGLGNDTIVCNDSSWAADGALGGAVAVGGVGNDTLRGHGWLWGDQAPGMPEQPGGRDRLDLLPDGDGVWAHGGLGRDTFTVEAIGDGSAVIDDFRAGEDKLIAYGNWHDVPENLYGRLDATRDGVLDYRDSIGPDGDWTTPDGGAVYTDGTNLYLGLDATWAGTDATDATCWLTLNNVTSVSAADWLFPDGFD